MGFKKIEIGKKNKGVKKLIPFLFSLISVFLVFSLGLFFIDSTSGLKMNFLSFLNVKIGDLGTLGIDTTNSKATNILIIGRGGGSHDAPNLTDSIILASVDTKKDITTMLSIPRDLYVEIKTPNGKTKGKINEIYSRNLDSYKKTEAQSVKELEDKVTQITGINIDYFVDIDFESFKTLIDFMGGIEVTVDENLVDYEYPDENNGYTTFVLRKGTWILDGDTALKYARSRHSTSDFDRSLRQQKILSSIKDKLLKEGYITSPSKITKMYTLLKDYIKTDIDLATLINLALGVKENHQVFSFNLNDSCFYAGICFKGGLLYVPERDYFGGLSVLIPQSANISNISNYSEIQKYSDIIFNHRDIFIENVPIAILNGAKKANLARVFSNSLFKYGFNIPEENLGNTKTEDGAVQNTTILYNNIDEDNETLQLLHQISGIPLKKTESPLYSSSEIRIELVIGSDYQIYQK